MMAMPTQPWGFIRLPYCGSKQPTHPRQFLRDHHRSPRPDAVARRLNAMDTSYLSVLEADMPRMVAILLVAGLLGGACTTRRQVQPTAADLQTIKRLAVVVTGDDP